jgi:hypothetical protein
LRAGYRHRVKMVNDVGGENAGLSGVVRRVSY